MGIPNRPNVVSILFGVGCLGVLGLGWVVWGFFRWVWVGCLGFFRWVWGGLFGGFFVGRVVWGFFVGAGRVFLILSIFGIYGW